MSTARDQAGDPVTPSHVELPETAAQLEANRARPYRPGAVEAAAQAWSEDVWQERHGDCEAPWYCEKCERPQCPRCHPSPAEFRLCADCDWRNAA